MERPHIQFRVDRRPTWMMPGVDIRILLLGNPGDAVILSHGQGATGVPACVTQLITAPLTGPAEIPPALALQEEDAQQLCDALWEAGIRPTNGAGSTGQLAATRDHLADMRKIVFQSLGIKGE